MVKVKDVLKFLEAAAPSALKMDFDNVGLLVGFEDAQVGRILVSLDITDEVVKEAIDRRAQLVVSHHPLFFSLKSVTDGDRTGRKVVRLISAGISAICMHTNLDAAEGGVSDVLARAAGLKDVSILCQEAADPEGNMRSYGRVGWLEEPMGLQEYLGALKERLNTGGLRYHDAGRQVFKVAVAGGSGGGYIKQAAALGCDTLLTADVKYDVFLEAREIGLNLIDGDHFCTENVVVPDLAGRLKGEFPGVEVLISERHGQTARFFC